MRGTNLIGVVPGADTNLPPLLLAAHYDSVIAAPCADDNAAAVAIALHLAERIGPGRLERDLVVALFDAEEPPYFQCPEMGSIRFFDDQMDGRGVHCAVVMDLVGHDLPVEMIAPAVMVTALGIEREDFERLKEVVFMTGAESHTELPGLVRATLQWLPLRLVAALNRYIGDMSDHHVFRISGVPYLFFSCGRWPHYHQPSDTPEKLDFMKMLGLAGFLEGLVGRLDQAELVEPEARVLAGGELGEPAAVEERELAGVGEAPAEAGGRPTPSGSMADLLRDRSRDDHSLQFEIETLRTALGNIFPILALMLGKTGLSTRGDMDAVADLLLRLGL
jgi:hypothetical protein